MASIHRHKKSGHVLEKVAKAAEAKELLSADKLLKIIESLLAESIRTVREAKSGDETTKLRAVKEARETAKLLLEVQGKINSNETIVTVNIIENQWNDFRTAVLAVMCPECRDAVVKMLREQGGPCRLPEET